MILPNVVRRSARSPWDTSLDEWAYGVILLALGALALAALCGWPLTRLVLALGLRA